MTIKNFYLILMFMILAHPSLRSASSLESDEPYIENSFSVLKEQFVSFFQSKKEVLSEAAYNSNHSQTNVVYCPSDDFASHKMMRTEYNYYTLNALSPSELKPYFLNLVKDKKEDNHGLLSIPSQQKSMLNRYKAIDILHNPEPLYTILTHSCKAKNAKAFNYLYCIPDNQVVPENLFKTHFMDIASASFLEQGIQTGRQWLHIPELMEYMQTHNEPILIVGAYLRTNTLPCLILFNLTFHGYKNPFFCTLAF